MKSSFKLHEIPATVRAAMCIVKVKPEVPPWARVNIDEALFVHLMRRVMLVKRSLSVGCDERMEG